MRNLGLLPRWLRLFAEPFEIPLAASAVFSGALAAFAASQPPSLAAQLSPWQVRAWGVLLLLGGVLTLAARVIMASWWAESPSTAALVAAHRLEMAGMLLLAGTGIAYALAILAVGLTGAPAGAFTLAWGGACGMRAWIVSRQLALFTRVRRRGAGPDG